MSTRKMAYRPLELPGYWRIVWYGRLREVTHHNTQPYIHAYLGELGDPASGDALPLRRARLRQVLIPATDLPLLPLNSVLKDGALFSTPLEFGGFTSTGPLFLNFSRSKVSVVHRIGDRGRYFPLSPYVPEDEDNYEGLLVCFHTEEATRQVLVPCVEIFRFFFAQSSRLAMALLNGWFHDADRNIFNGALSVFSSQTSYLKLRQRMLDNDAKHIARFAFDNYALRQAQRIHIRAAVAEEELLSSGSPPTGHETRRAIAHPVPLTDPPRLLRALPPFEGLLTTETDNEGHARHAPVRVEGIGKEVLCKDGVRRLFIPRLTACDWPLPFTHLVYDRDNDGRPDKRDDEERTPLVRKARVPTHPIDPNDDDIEIDDTGFGTVVQAAKVPVVAYPFGDNVQAEKAPQADCEYSNREKYQEAKDAVWDGLLSTVKGPTAFEAVREALLVGMDELSELPWSEGFGDTDEPEDEIEGPTLHSTLEWAQRLLSAADGREKCVDFPRFWRSKVPEVKGVPLYSLPRTIGGLARAFLYRDADNTRRRRFWVARLRFQGRVRYVIDFEVREGKREESDSRAPTQNPWQTTSFFVLWSSDEKEVQDAIIAKAIGKIARNRGTHVRQLIFQGIAHGTREHRFGTPIVPDEVFSAMFSVDSLVGPQFPLPQAVT